MHKETVQIKKLLILSILIAISFILSRWQIPLIPPYSFLKFDLSEAPLIIAVLLYPELTLITALAYTAIVYMLHDPLGATFKVIAVLSMIIPIGIGNYLIKKEYRTTYTHVLLITTGILIRIFIMVGVNYYLLEIKHVMGNFTLPPIYYTIVIPAFNSGQALINAITAYITVRYIQKAQGEEGI